MIAAVLGALVVVAAWTPRPPVPAHRRLERRRGSGDVDAAVLCDLLDAALASGAAVPRALTGLGEAIGDSDAGRALRTAGTALLLGAPWEQAWQGVPREVADLAHALEPAWSDGTDPGPAVRRAAMTIRMRREAEAREAAARLGVRLVLPLGLCSLPAFVLLGIVPALMSAGGAVFGP